MVYNPPGFLLWGILLILTFQTLYFYVVEPGRFHVRVLFFLYLTCSKFFLIEF